MNKKFYAILMIIMILSMPVTFAQSTISQINVYGQDNTNGYNRETNDDAIVEAVVKIDNESFVSPGQVKIEDVEFDTCVEVNNNFFKCKYVEDGGFFEAKSYPFTVSLYSESGSIVATKDASITIDNINPVIEDLEVKQIGNDIKVTYKLTDSACPDASCAGKCSGFKRIEFVGIKQSELNATGKCSYTDSEILDLESGTYVLNVNVYDGAGNIGSYTSQSFTVDKTLPRVETNEALFFKDGKEVSYIGVNGLQHVDILVYIEESNLAEVIGDLSSLNKITHYKIAYENLKASCRDLGGVHLCQWNDVYLFPEQASGQIDLSIKDGAGNNADQSVPFSLQLDNQKPSIVSIESNCNGGLCYLKEKNNTLKMKISESGSGFEKAILINGQKKYFVGLNLGQLNSIYSKEWADDCAKEDNLWTCYWHNIEVAKNHGSFVKASLAEGSQDDAGNALEGVLESEFIVDKKGPIVKEATINSGEFGYLLQGEGLNIKLVLEEDSPVLAIGRFGGVINEGQNFQKGCASSNKSEYICEWNNIGSIVPGPLIDAEYEIELIDFSGNSVIYNNTVDIVEAEGLPKNYWRMEGNVLTRPAAISKDTLFKSQKVYFVLPLVSSVKNIKIVDAILTSCAGTGLELNKRIIATDNGIFVSGQTKGGLGSINEINAECKLQIISVINRERVTQPQNIDISLKLPVVDSRAGTVGATVANKIKKAREQAKMTGIFGILEKIYDISEKVCTGLRLATLGSDLFHKLSLGPAGLIDALKTNPPTAPAAVKAHVSLDGAAKSQSRVIRGITQSLKKFCGFMSCEKGSFSGPLSNFYESMSKTTEANSAPGMWPSNPKDNLLLSAMTGCIPGVMYNLKKRQQIQCLYIDCLENQVPTGVPVAFCDNQVAYQECRFVYGQIFDLIPFAHIVKKFGQTIQNLFHDPVSLILGLSEELCSSPSAKANAMCRIISSSKKVQSILQDFKALKENKNLLDKFDGAANICKKVGI